KGPVAPEVNPQPALAGRLPSDRIRYFPASRGRSRLGSVNRPPVMNGSSRQTSVGAPPRRTAQRSAVPGVIVIKGFAAVLSKWRLAANRAPNGVYGKRSAVLRTIITLPVIG